MAGLHGEYRHKLDAKGRLSLPAAFRKSLSSESLIVTQSPKGECLYVFEVEAFDEWVKSLFARIGGFDPSNVRHVKQRKLLNSRANDIAIDASGRIGLSPSMRSAVDLAKDVVLVGDSDHFEIWDASRWDEFCEDADLDSLFTE